MIHALDATKVGALHLQLPHLYPIVGGFVSTAMGIHLGWTSWRPDMPSPESQDE